MHWPFNMSLSLDLYFNNQKMIVHEFIVLFSKIIFCCDGTKTTKFLNFWLNKYAACLHFCSTENKMHHMN